MSYKVPTPSNKVTYQIRHTDFSAVSTAQVNFANAGHEVTRILSLRTVDGPYYRFLVHLTPSEAATYGL